MEAMKKEFEKERREKMDKKHQEKLARWELERLQEEANKKQRAERFKESEKERRYYAAIRQAEINKRNEELRAQKRIMDAEQIRQRDIDRRFAESDAAFKRHQMITNNFLSKKKQYTSPKVSLNRIKKNKTQKSRIIEKYGKLRKAGLTRKLRSVRPALRNDINRPAQSAEARRLAFMESLTAAPRAATPALRAASPAPRAATPAPRAARQYALSDSPPPRSRRLPSQRAQSM